MPIYLVDHESFRPPEEYRVRLQDIDKVWTSSMLDLPFMEGKNTADREQAERDAMDVVTFQYRVFKKAGLSDDGTFLPPSIHPNACGLNPRTDLNSAADECREALCGAIDGLLAKTGLKATDVDILVTTCSIFCPTPSMASLVVNHFKMRTDVLSYSLGGMGCSNGVVAVNLVRDLLKAHPNMNAVFACTETTTPAFYRGRDKSRLVTNVLFRMGASAVLMSNKHAWAGRAKYRLVRSIRVHTGRVDDAYKCIWYGPDSEGYNGVSLGLNVVHEATRALTGALRTVAPTILTWRQVGEFLSSEVQRRLAKMRGQAAPPAFAPSFAEGVRHFLLHAGGSKVLDGLGASLKLDESHLEPSRAVLHDYGNVSSSTTWYALGFIETLRGVVRGDRVMQVGVGSGMKCGVNVWQAERDIDEAHGAWDHRITPERRGQLTARPPRYTREHVVRRVLFLLVLLGLALLMWRLMVTGGGGSVVLGRSGAGGVSDAPPASMPTPTLRAGSDEL